MGSTSSKVCVVCGTDCANTPRVKDPRGRYYCKPCYEAALERKKGAAGESHHAHHQHEHDDDDDHVESRAPTAGWGGSLLDDAPSGVPGSAGACPECGAALDEGAVLCVNCGYLLRAGKRIAPKIEDDEEAGDAPPIQGEATSRTKWPIVIGVFSIIFAVFGALSYGLMVLVIALTSPSEVGGPMIWAASLVLYPILFALSVALGVLAIGLFQRRRFAAIWLPRWAWGKILVSIAYAIVAAAGSTGSAIELPEEVQALGVLFIALGIGVMLLWLLFWPVFLLLWMRRKAIKSEVAAWA